jgi:hypothetical protein
MPKRIDMKQKSKHYRELLWVTTVAEVREQLRVWVREFEEQADVDNLEPVIRKRALTNSAS